MNTKLKTLGNRSLFRIRCWDDKDEKTCRIFQQFVRLDIQDDDDVVATYKEDILPHMLSLPLLWNQLPKQREQSQTQNLKKVFNRMVHHS